jgi:hypothetical protein
MLSKLQWLIILLLIVVAIVSGLPYMKDGYVGYYLAGKCDTPPLPRQCFFHLLIR